MLSCKITIASGKVLKVVTSAFEECVCVCVGGGGMGDGAHHKN